MVLRQPFKPLLLGCVLMAIAACQSASQPADPAGTLAEVPLIVGTYNHQGSEGIYALSYHGSPAGFSPPQLLAAADNPSFLHITSERLYAVNELGEGRLTTYQMSADGQLRELGSASTLGAAPCYVTLSPDGRFAATANYGGGNLSVFRLDQRGVAKESPHILQHSGRGHDPARQQAPHAHWVEWDRRHPYLYAVDLGIDQVLVYDVDPETGAADTGRTALQLEPGDGPRHLFFHPQQPLAYILNELSNTITVARQADNGSLTPIQRVATLPDDFAGQSYAAHIHITADGRHLYASNRGHDSIAVFRINGDGYLTLQQLESTRGQWPRHFLVLEDARALIVANQQSHNLVAFDIGDDGGLSHNGAEATLPQATFLGRR